MIANQRSHTTRPSDSPKACLIAESDMPEYGRAKPMQRKWNRTRRRNRCSARRWLHARVMPQERNSCLIGGNGAHAYTLGYRISAATPHSPPVTAAASELTRTRSSATANSRRCRHRPDRPHPASHRRTGLRVQMGRSHCRVALSRRQLKSSAKIEDVNFNGPALGVVFNG